MSEDTIRSIFASNLNYYLRLKGKSQADLCKYINISSSTVSNWCTGQKMPRADKIQSISNWLGVEIGDLMQEKSNKDLSKKDQKEITSIINNTRQLLTQEGLMFDGNPADSDDVQSILDAMQIGLEMAKKRNKEKYTPKKYQE